MTSPSDAATVTVRHEPERHQFVGEIGGEVVTVADYRDQGGAVVMHHTHTDRAHGGNGYAKQVVTAALNEFQAQGRRVVPACWFVAQVIEEEPRYSDLVAR